MADVQAFGLQFAEAIDYLKGKIPATTLSSDDLAGPAHAKIFTVAGSTKVDLVNDLHTAMTKTIEQGRTITDFRKDFDKAVAAHGWSYRGKRGWRSRIIYDTNMRSAHMAGRWKQIQANKDRKPYLMYKTAGDSRVRPEHLAWEGLVYPVDHAFWETHYPPNGWNCRCTVRPYSGDDLKELGVAPEENMPAGGARWVLDQDGNQKDLVPVGIDPGWDYNVGKAWIAPEVALGEKLARLPMWLRGEMSQKTVTPEFQRVIEANFKGFQERASTTFVERRRKQPDGTYKTVLVHANERNAQVLGFLDRALIEALAQKVPELNLRSTLLVHVDSNQKHLEGEHKSRPRLEGGAPEQVWPKQFAEQLPSHLASYQAILWDKESPALLFVPQARFNKTVPTAVFKQSRLKIGEAWELKSLGSRGDGKILKRSPRYQILVGDLP